MSCCGGHHNHQQDEHQHNGTQAEKNTKINWMMIICCVLPLAVAAVLLLSGTVSGNLGNSMIFLLALICPLSHMVIMPFMMRRNKNHS